MIFTPTLVEGAFVVDLEPVFDSRGFFSRAWCTDEARRAGIEAEFVQTNLSLTQVAGTVRGLHYQVPPFGEGKLIRCIRGTVFDVVADVRSESPSLGRWFGTELSAESRRAVYLPAGCAHGFQSLSDEAELLYNVTAPYMPEAEAGLRHDDPFFAIEWPMPVVGPSDKDRAWPDFEGP